eukprot:2694841-Rhodomonas_salina.1
MSLPDATARLSLTKLSPARDSLKWQPLSVESSRKSTRVPVPSSHRKRPGVTKFQVWIEKFCPAGGYLTCLS